MLRVDKFAAPKTAREAAPIEMITSLPTVTGVNSLPAILIVEVSLKPLTESKPSPKVYSIRLFFAPLANRIKSLPLPPLKVTFAPPLSIKSSPEPPAIETIAPEFEIESLPPRASIVTP